MRVVAKWTKVDRLATLAKEQKPVELLEKDSARLVNRAEHRLRIHCALAKAVDEIAHEVTLTWPLSASLRKKAQMAHADWLSRPLVGSSKNSNLVLISEYLQYIARGRGVGDLQLRFSSQLDSNRQQLALLHVQTFAGNAYDGLREVLHTEHLDDTLYVLVLLGLADTSGLAEKSGEAEGLPDGGRLEVEVLLLYCRGLSVLCNLP